MFRNMVMGLAMIAITVLMSGCDGHKGNGFIGHWVGGSERIPSYLDITYEDGIYHVNRTAKSLLTGKMETKHLEATAASDSVLNINRGITVLNLRLEKGKILVQNETYIKSEL